MLNYSVAELRVYKKGIENAKAGNNKTGERTCRTKIQRLP